MELTDAMIEEIRRGFREVEYGKVIIEVEGRGPGQSVDISVTSRRRYAQPQPTDGNTDTTQSAGRKYAN